MGELIKVKIAKVPKGTVRSGGRTSGSISSGASIEFAQRAVYAHYADEADKAALAERAKEADRLTSEAAKDLERAVLSKLFIPYLDTAAKTWADVRKDEDFNSVKIKISLWTDGFLSAHGQNPQGGGGTAGKSYLSQLLDVDLSTLSSGEVLTWNGTKWVNSALTLPDMAGYALKSWVEANYQPKGDYLTNSEASTFFVSKFGDSMTGALNISNSEATQIWLNSNGAAETGIGLKVNSATLGWVGYNTYRGTVLYTYDGGHYLGIHPNGTPRFDSNVIWHQGNDGSGSGLDADLLDGNHLADILASNVASASRLQTARTIWGHDFDGTGNVSGTLSEVEHIIMSGGIISGGSSQGAYIGHSGAGLGDTYTGGLLYAYGNNPLYFYTNSSRRIMIAGNGNVGIGTDSSAYKLDVNGATRTTALVIGDCTISWDAASNMLKVDRGLYSTGGVSAHGVNANAGGGGSGGKNYLSDLLDVQLGTPADGQTLVYKNNKWVNEALFTPSLAGYALESWVKLNFVSVDEFADSSEAFLQNDGSNATWTCLDNLIRHVVGVLKTPVDTDIMLFNSDGSCYINRVSSLWDYVKNKTDRLYLGYEGDGATEFTLYNMMSACFAGSSIVDKDRFFAASWEEAEGVTYSASDFWTYIKSKMGLAFTVDGDNVSIGCQPGTLTLNGVKISSGSAITCNSLSAQGVHIKYQGKTYTLQLAKLIQAGYLTA